MMWMPKPNAGILPQTNRVVACACLFAAGIFDTSGAGLKADCRDVEHRLTRASTGAAQASLSSLFEHYVRGPVTPGVRPLQAQSSASLLLQNSVVSHILSLEDAMSFNKITMVGNLGRDPEFRRLPNGIPVCNFTIAVNETYRDKTGAYRTTPTWFRVAVWGERAMACAENLKKGKPVYVAGRLRQREWKDDDGKQHYTLEVRASDVRFFGTAGSRGIKMP